MFLVLCYFPWGKEDIYLDYVQPEVASVFWLMCRSDKNESTDSQGSGCTQPWSGRDSRPSVKLRFRTPYYKMQKV